MLSEELNYIITETKENCLSWIFIKKTLHNVMDFLSCSSVTNNKFHYDLVPISFNLETDKRAKHSSIKAAVQKSFLNKKNKLVVKMLKKIISQESEIECLHYPGLLWFKLIFKVKI